MNRGSTAKTPMYPVRLRDAQMDIFARMPRGDSPLSAWVEFHRYNARMFKSMAETDPDHKWEALANHGVQLRCVERLTRRPEWKEDYAGGAKPEMPED